MEEVEATHGHGWMLQKQADLADANYQEAIELRKQANHLHHLGLLHERYAHFWWEICSFEANSREQLTKAIQYYEEWAAAAKVQSLMSRL